MICGLKNFPLAVVLEDNEKLVEAEFGVKGFAIMVKLWQAISAHGYYMKWDIDAQLLFMRDYHLETVGRSCVSEVVACCIRRGVFDKNLFEKYQILTSRRAQETFLNATKRSEKVIMEKDYCLPIVYTFIETASKKGKIVNIFWKNADNFKQRKEKERKEYTPYNPPNQCEQNVRNGTDGTIEGYLEFMREHPDIIEDLNNPSELYGIDFKLLAEKIEESKRYLKGKNSLKFIIRHYGEIIADSYKDFKREAEQKTPPPKTNGKGDLQLWQELMGALRNAKEESHCEEIGYDYPLYEMMTEEAKEEMSNLYKGLSPEIISYFDPNSFLELCKMEEKDLKYERARFLKALPEIRSKLAEGQNGAC